MAAGPACALAAAVDQPEGAMFAPPCMPSFVCTPQHDSFEDANWGHLDAQVAYEKRFGKCVPQPSPITCASGCWEQVP